MHIRHVTIENVRRFGEGRERLDLDLPPRGWIVAAGRNGAGKTTFLKVLALALSGQFAQGFADTMFGWLRSGATKGRSLLSVGPDDDDELVRDGVTILSTKAADEEILIGDDWSPSFGAMRHGRESDGNRAVAGPWHATARGWFAAGYGAERRLLGSASVSDDWASSVHRESAFLTLFRPDAALTHPIQWLMALHHRQSDPYAKGAEQKEAKHTVELALALLRDGLLPDVEIVRVDSHGLCVRQGDVETYVQHLGAGAQTLAALVLDILRQMTARFGRLRSHTREGRTEISHSGVVLIDEADAHLHPAWQQRLGFWMMEHFPSVQFIVTTHSPFICQAAVPGGLIRLPAPGESEPSRVLDEDDYWTIVNGGADDSVLSVLFGLEHPHSPSSEMLRERIATLEAQEIRKGLKSGERKALDRLRGQLPRSGEALVEQTLRKLRASS